MIWSSGILFANYKWLDKPSMPPLQPSLNHTSITALTARIRLSVLLRALVMLGGFIGVIAFMALNSQNLHLPDPVPIVGAAGEKFSDVNDAREALRLLPTTLSVSNNRSIAPIWILVNADNLTGLDDNLIVVGDKTLRQVQMWAFDSRGHLIGDIKASGSDYGPATSTIPIRRFDQGFYFDPAGLTFDSLLLKAHAVGSSKIYVGIQSKAAFADASKARQNLAAGLTGALLVLAAFTAVIASFTHNSALAATAFWIVSLLGVTAITLGYDLMWLSYNVPAIVELRFKQLILALLMISSCLLYESLFRQQVARLQLRKVFSRISLIVSLAAPLAALLLPTAIFVPTFFLFSFITLAFYGWCTVRIAWKFRHPAITIFCWSWGSITVCLVAEISYATGVINRIPGLSFETGAIIGAFLAASAATTNFHFERKRRLQAMTRSRRVARQYRAIYNNVPTGIITLDSNCLIVQTNRAARELFNNDSLEQIPLESVIGRATLFKLLNNAGATKQSSHATQIHHGEHTLNLQAISTPAGVEIAVTDVSAMAQLQETLEHQATHDYLTGAKSWYGMNKAILALQSQLNNNRTGTFLHIKVNNFHAISKLHGRQAADNFLKEVALRITKCAGAQACTSRSGNEEFSVFWLVSDADDSFLTATEIAEEISGNPFTFRSISVRLSVNVGMAFGNADVPAEEALVHAQRACDEAEANGSDSISVFDRSGPVNERLHIERFWDKFVQSGDYRSQMDLWVQPIVPLQEGSGKQNLEVLLRLRNQHGDVHLPGSFIDAAQRHSLMPDIDRYIVEQTLIKITENPAIKDRVGYVAVNLSAASINSRNFLGDLTILISRYPEAAGSLCLEITESIALMDLPATRNFTEEMHAMGIQLALDDFGSGYTSFAYIQSLSAQVLKMDGTFVRDLERNPQAQSIVSSIISMSHALGMSCVAEWVETRETADRLTMLGCDYAQGFHYGPVQQFSRWIASAEQIVRTDTHKATALTTGANR